MFGVAVTKLTCDTPSGILMPVRLKPGNHLTTGNGTARYLFELFNLMPAPPANRIEFAVDLLLDSRNLHCGRLTITVGCKAVDDPRGNGGHASETPRADDRSDPPVLQGYPRCVPALRHQSAAARAFSADFFSM